MYFSLLMSAIVLGSASQLNAERIFFANGRSMSVKDYQIGGDVMTVTLRGGGQAIFDKSIIARVVPDEVPDVDETVAAAAEASPCRWSMRGRSPSSSKRFRSEARRRPGTGACRRAGGIQLPATGRSQAWVPAG